MSILIGSNLPNLYYRGKVRDTYEMGNDLLLIIATDRVSAYGIGCQRQLVWMCLDLS